MASLLSSGPVLAAAVLVSSLVLPAISANLQAPVNVRRGNTVMTREIHRPVYSFAALLRIGVLAGSGSGVIQPVGFGAALQFRYHALGAGPLRFGLELTFGHTRFLERVSVPAGDPASSATAVRWAALGHTDFAAGPSFQIVLRSVLIELGGGAGISINDLVRPVGPRDTDEHQVSDVSALVSGGAHVGIPIRNNQGILIGCTVQKMFSRTRIVREPAQIGDPDAVADVAPFDLVVAPYLGYQIWF